MSETEIKMFRHHVKTKHKADPEQAKQMVRTKLKQLAPESTSALILKGFLEEL